MIQWTYAHIVIGIAIVVLSHAASAQPLPNEGQAPDRAWTTWSELEDLLKPGYAAGGREDLEKMPIAQELLRRNHPTLWRAMTLKPQYPLVSIVGFRLLHATQPENEVLDSALMILSLADNPASPIYDPAADYLTGRAWRAEDVLAFNSTFAHSSVKLGNAAYITSIIDGDILQEWLQSPEAENADPSKVALVIDVIAGDIANRGDDAPEWVEDWLDRLGAVPGMGRYVSVFHSREESPGLRDRMAAVIRDDEVTDFQLKFIVRRKGALMRSVFDVIEDDLPEARKEVVRAVIREASEGRKE